MSWFLVLVILGFAVGYYQWQLNQKRLLVIKNLRFDASITRRLADKYPHLTSSQTQQILEGLRDYFYMVLMARGKGMLSMPSQAADEAWHAFILSTKAYNSFCQRAFGKFLHHHPAETMTTQTQASNGIKRTWNLACRHEKINAANPQRLPRLFALDGEFKIANGFVYSLQCMALGAAANSYCASNIGSGCGGGSSCSGDNSNDSDSGGDSGCGGGCGGD
ncbi:MAG: hypothetical protein H6996_00945 [Moraxellaceae bacterium]|nr:hypothetical protein [Pseudomonadales bacterium]MCP5173653.1 hypothetical protein [Moraxellaceae bacterium]MCP5178256.1 hypothetical protein [Moraxellaceae bacterium]